MKVAVLGSGGREHALVWKLNQNERIDEFFCVPGDPGIAQLAKCVSLPLHDPQILIHWANKVDGFAAGKGVTLATSIGEAEVALRASLEEIRFGEEVLLF